MAKKKPNWHVHEPFEQEDEHSPHQSKGKIDATPVEDRLMALNSGCMLVSLGKLLVYLVWDRVGSEHFSKAHPSDANPAVRVENHRTRLLEKRTSHW